MEVEGVINSRPLCYIYDTNGDNIITSSHLEKIDQQTVQNMTKRAQHIKNTFEHFGNDFRTSI